MDTLPLQAILPLGHRVAFKIIMPWAISVQVLTKAGQVAEEGVPLLSAASKATEHTRVLLPGPENNVAAPYLLCAA